MSTSRSLVVNVPRVHRRRDNISESLLQEETSSEPTTLSVSEEVRVGVVRIPNVVVAWVEFWKRAKIYPEQTESVSEHVSSRHRGVRNQESDYETESSDDGETECIVVVVCRGCRDKQANQTAHMDYGGCLYMGVVN
jgi:hypothetical protein